MVTNHGPRPKQIRPLTNNGIVVTDGRILGIGPSKPDWLDVTIDDVFDPMRADGRLAVGDGNGPYSLTGVADDAAFLLFYVPFSGDQIALWNGTRWVNHTIPDWDQGGPSLDTSALARDGSGLVPAENYDVYVYDNGGTLTLELVRWDIHGAGGAERDPANMLATRNGILVLSSDHTHRYIGTIRTYPDSILFINSHQFRLVWNMYNRVLLASMKSVSVGGQITTPFVTSIPWGPPGSPNSQFPIEMVFGLPMSVRANFTLIPRCFAQTGVIITSDVWRCHNTIYLNSQNGALLSGQNQSISVTSITRQGLAQPGTQKNATMWLPAMFSSVLEPGYHFLQPMWAAEDIINCSGCGTFEIGTLIAAAYSTVEYES